MGNAPATGHTRFMRMNEFQAPARHAARPVRRSNRVLIVDDDAELRTSLQALLESAGYEVETASNGAQALEKQLGRPAAILVSDIFMPEADGLETIHAFRMAYPQMRIVAISGHSDPRMKVNYLSVAAEAGADVLLRKPFGSRALLDAVRG